MKDMRVVVKILTYALHSEPPWYTMSQVMRMSLDPATPCSTGDGQSHYKPVRCQLTFISSNDDDTFTADSPLPSSIAPLQNPVVFLQQPPSKCTLPICDDLDDEEEEEDFQTVSLEDDHWTLVEIPNRH